MMCAPLDVDLKRLGAVLAVAYERNLHDFAELLLLEKLGPRTLQSLALVAEVIHGAPNRFDDPPAFRSRTEEKMAIRFRFPLKTYDESLNFLRTSLDRAKAAPTGGDSDRVAVRKRKARGAPTPRDVLRARLKPVFNLKRILLRSSRTNARSRLPLNGRTVFDDRPQGSVLYWQGPTAEAFLMLIAHASGVLRWPSIQHAGGACAPTD